MQGVANTFFSIIHKIDAKTPNPGGETFSPVNSLHVSTISKNKIEIKNGFGFIFGNGLKKTFLEQNFRFFVKKRPFLNNICYFC